MSGPPPGPGPARSMSVGTGPPSAGIPPHNGMPPQQQQHGPPSGGSSGPQSQQNLNQIVLEYLSKKGYVRTEAMLRKESEPQANGQTLATQSTEAGGAKYIKAFELLRKYTEDNLDLYRPELRKLMWPIFVYSFLDLVREFYTKDAEMFFSTYQNLFEHDHEDDVRTLRQVRLQPHLQESRIAKLYIENKYRITLTTMPFYNLIQFLESKQFDGGQTLMDVIRDHLNIVTVDRTATAEKSIAAILAGGKGDEDLPAEDEGIPGHNPGHPLTTRHDPDADAARIRLLLGPYPQDEELIEDVRATLQEEDAKGVPRPGQSTLVDEFEQRIKRESPDDGPSRDTVPLPPSLARDISMEVQKIIEHRDRYKMEGRTGGVGPAVSVTMYTFHNTFDSINCIDFSGDNRHVAGVWQSPIFVYGQWTAALLPLPTTHLIRNHPRPAASSATPAPSMQSPSPPPLPIPILPARPPTHSAFCPAPRTRRFDCGH